MSDVESWREKASALRELAKYTVDAEAKEVLLALAEDCQELSAARSAHVIVLQDRSRRPPSE